ncbi:pentatricopeptide (PPR) repeat-containing protein [Ectocarpus siliculosus]|uniref:Pentatricopeptide (PPR) repeat-containing protein n=1 Tax=Ectocarpus siliculosus TaxID=2880 RepID=D7FK82_ECTSI|nr:pentatricopeptide (PPR) repeat-containing protein [Ectocarpus siliculosus]|eukprot:CBJ29287.1 pentatricopeptide (PPR) repeat-containing protein [Ectocarpus siliculosus]
MLRARTLAAQCLRREAAARSRCSGRSAGAACAAAMPTPGSSRVVHAGCTLRRCLQSDAPGAATATTQSDGSGGLMQHSDVAAQGSQEAGALRTAPAPDPALRFDFDDDVAGLVERLNYLGTQNRDNSNRNNGASAAKEGLQLLQAARSRGTKDARLYKAVFKLLSVNTNAAAISSLSEQMKQDGIKPDVETYNLIIYGYASSKDVAGARRTYEELLSSGLEANETTLSNMVVANSWKDIDEMRRFGSAGGTHTAPGCCTVEFSPL